MAVYRVQAPDGSILRIEGPDNAKPEEVEAFAAAQYKPKTASEKPWNPADEMSGGEKFMAGVGKAFVDPVRGIGQMLGVNSQAEIDKARKLDAPLMDTGAGFAGNVAGNLASAFVPGGNSVKGAALVGGALSALQPTATGESRAENAAWGAALGGGVRKGAELASSALASRAAARAVEGANNATRDAAIAAGKAEGFVVPPSVSGGPLAARLAEGLSGKYKTNQAMSIKNQTIGDRLARKAVGLPEDAPLTPETLKAVRSKAYQAGYEPVAGAGVVKTDAAYKAALDKISAKYVGAAKDFPGDDAVTGFINSPKRLVPERADWVDDAGRVVPDFVEPKAPKLRNFLDELKKAGGISPKELDELNVERMQRNYPGIVSNKGRSADGILEWARENGWITQRMIDDAAELPGGEHELVKDMIRAAAARETVVHPSQVAKWQNYQRASKEALESGIQKRVTPAKEIAGLRVDEFDAGNGIKKIQILRDEAAEAFRKGETSLGRAKREAAQALEDQIERHLASFGDGAGAGELLDNFRAARQLMAKAHSVEKALVADTGHVNMQKLAAELQRGKPLTGELRTMAAFAKNAKDVTRVPESGWANPLTAVDFGMGAIGAGISPAALALPVARVAARKALMSGPIQSRIGPSYEAGLLGRAASKALADERALRAMGLLAPSIYAAQQ